MRRLCAVPGPLSRGMRWAIVSAITNDRHHEDEVEFVDKKTSRRSTNKASALRAATQEHRAVVGLVNPAEEVSDME